MSATRKRCLLRQKYHEPGECLIEISSENSIFDRIKM